jgi:hypothetical protein
LRLLLLLLLSVWLVMLMLLWQGLRMRCWAGQLLLQEWLLLLLLVLVSLTGMRLLWLCAVSSCRQVVCRGLLQLLLCAGGSACEVRLALLLLLQALELLVCLQDTLNCADRYVPRACRP